MYLNNKQLLLLIFPFFLSYGVYFFSEEIVENAHYFFPTYKKYSNRDLDAKVDNYLQIETKYILFQDIQDKVESRKKEAKWIAANLFYKKQDVVKTEAGKKISTKPFTYRLQALFPDDKTAIINDSIVREGSMVYGAKVIKIERSQVLIKTNKGLQWLFLFQ